VQLEHADLHERDQRCGVIDGRVRILALRDCDARHDGRDAGADVLLVEALRAVTVGAAEQRQRPPT
jgi:hypothetical protein